MGVQDQVTSLCPAALGLQSFPSGRTSAALTQAALTGRWACDSSRMLENLSQLRLSIQLMARAAGLYHPRERG